MTTPTEPPVERLDADQLRTLFLFEALDEQQLAWLGEHGRVERYLPGAPVYTADTPATCFFVLLEGTMLLSRRIEGHDVEITRTSHRGAYSGATRAWIRSDDEQQVYIGSARAITGCAFLVLPAEDFGEALQRWFPMAMHLLDGLYHGIRSANAVVGQRERLQALGRLTAGLTHELNNPAAAAVRATATLRERGVAMRHKLAHLASGKVDADTLVALSTIVEEAIEKAAKAPSLTALQAGDAEDELSDWFDEHDVSDGWQLAPTLVAAGLGIDWLEEVAVAVPADHLAKGLRWIGYSLETEQLLHEIEDATARISALVGAAKQYSQMDRADHQRVDVHDGLDSTLVMLNRKLGPDVTVVTEYDRSLPQIPAYPAELNQVWTNLIDNAAGAMDGHGTLTLRTGRDGDMVLVEICDTGPGVPAELSERIFEPFFTTKPIGEGTGLGLDISFRIVVNRHGGDLRVVSKPGETRFQVRLPTS